MFITALALVLFGLTSLDTCLETGPALALGVTDAYRLQPAMAWLRENSRPGDIVFTPAWDVFPELFFWNQKDRYPSGMDPIFMYRYDPELYWISNDLRYRGATATAHTGPPTDANGATIETFDALSERFRASYCLFLKAQTPELLRYAFADRRFHPVFDSDAAVVFALPLARDYGPMTMRSGGVPDPISGRMRRVY